MHLPILPSCFALESGTGKTNAFHIISIHFKAIFYSWFHTSSAQICLDIVLLLSMRAIRELTTEPGDLQLFMVTEPCCALLSIGHILNLWHFEEEVSKSLGVFLFLPHLEFALV